MSRFPISRAATISELSSTSGVGIYQSAVRLAVSYVGMGVTIDELFVFANRRHVKHDFGTSKLSPLSFWIAFQNEGLALTLVSQFGAIQLLHEISTTSEAERPSLGRAVSAAGPITVAIDASRSAVGPG